MEGFVGAPAWPFQPHAVNPQSSLEVNGHLKYFAMVAEKMKKKARFSDLRVIGRNATVDLGGVANRVINYESKGASRKASSSTDLPYPIAAHPC